MKQVLLITATRCKTEKEFESRPIYRSLHKLYNIYDRAHFDFHVVRDNTEGLSVVYNRFLTDEYKDKIVAFVHDDVEVEDLFFVEKLNESPFDVTALAGAVEFNKSAEKLAWHLASGEDKKRGEVTHAAQGKVWTTCFWKHPRLSGIERVLVFDGVFVAVNVEKALKAEVLFDERFGFHFYDISFSLNCFEKKLTAGVIPLRIVHHGLGDSMNTPEWEDANKKFKGAYCNQIEAV
jgi:hypothetical protein